MDRQPDRARLRALLRAPPLAAHPQPDPTFVPPGWFADHPVFEQLVGALKPRLVLDVGSLWGASCVRLARLARAASPGVEVTVVAIDTWLGSKEHFIDVPFPSPADYRYGTLFHAFCGNVARAGQGEVVIPFAQTSQAAAEVLAHYRVAPDLVYLDAAHEYRAVLADLEAYWALLPPGGVLFGDDFEEPHYGVIRAVLEFADKVGQRPQLAKAPASGPDGGRRVNCKYVLQKEARTPR